MGEPLACSSPDDEKEWCIRASPWDLKQLQPRLPPRRSQQPNGLSWRLLWLRKTQNKLKKLFKGFKTKGGHKLSLPNGFQLSFNKASLGFILVFKMIYFYCMCMCVCLHVYKCAMCLTSTKRRHQIPRPGVTGKVVSLLGTESSSKAASGLNCWAMSPAQPRPVLMGKHQRACAP